MTVGVLLIPTKPECVTGVFCLLKKKITHTHFTFGNSRDAFPKEDEIFPKEDEIFQSYIYSDK